MRIKKYWLHDDVFKSTFFDATSLIIPYVEEFIIDELTHIKSRIKDENILSEYNRLIEEERAHSKIHHHYNKMLQMEGYKLNMYVNTLLTLRSFFHKFLSLKSRLAICAAIEHLTASMSLLAIEHNAMEKGVDERMKRVWQWHFYEEIDHRSNMFDIYKYLGGGYVRRVIYMVLSAVMFFLFTPWVRSGMLYQSGHFFDLSIHWKGAKYLWGKNGYHRILIKSFFKYLHPHFHPSQVIYSSSIAQHIHRYKIEDDLIKIFP